MARKPASSFKKYAQLVRVLKKHAPCAYPVSVKRKKLNKKLEGLCWKDAKKFVIHIHDEVDEARAIDILLHEWAHAMAWNSLLDTAKTHEEFDKLSHDGSWGVAYSKVYNVYEQHFLPTIT